MRRLNALFTDIAQNQCLPARLIARVKVRTATFAQCRMIERNIMDQLFEQAGPTSGGRSERVVEHYEVRSEKVDPAMHQEMLLREMQHRVANSLQIVASILSLKARKVRSDDARLHLLDAYDRVMAVATVQRQLLNANLSSVIRIDDYLLELSERLAKSLTHNVRLSVVVDGASTMESNKAVTLGLVVTELVINALRHAFPKERPGKIVLVFRGLGSRWSFSVTDNGVGLSNVLTNTMHAGHGTKILNCLATELDARIEVESNSQGTRVSLTHLGDREETINMRARTID